MKKAMPVQEPEGERGGIFTRLARSGAAGSALSAGLGVIDAVFSPGAARAREELDHQHRRVLPTPSPGDRMLDDGVMVIDTAE